MMRKSIKNTYIYIIMITVFSFLIYISLKNGIALHKLSTQTYSGNDGFSGILLHMFKNNLAEPLMTLLMQIIIILLFCKIFSSIFNLMGQPGVLGEIIAGIILGPSVLGNYFPGAFNFIFSKESLENVYLISQIGLILFMFVIGLEVDFKVLKNKFNETLVISHAGILVPFFLGIVSSFYIYEKYASQQTSFLAFALFIGISMSITAFPVLARIVQERNLAKTQLGVLSIASAANDDVTAWCLLAIVIALTKSGTSTSALFTVGLTIIYILFMFLCVRPFFRKISQIHANNEIFNKSLIGLIFLTLIISASITELIGIHALFGGFIAGVVMPSNLGFRHIMMNKVEDVTLAFFLPLFFAYTGLNTNLLLINSWSMVGICLLLIVIAIAGKFGGCTIAAKLVGETWHDSLTIGMLMNTRGLMELVALNIGYEMGVLPKSIYAVLIIMALVTTFMTTPALHLISKVFNKHKKSVKVRRQKIMLSFGLPSSGPNLLRVSKLIFGASINQKQITAAHFTQGMDVNMITAEHYAHDRFLPIEDEASQLNIKLTKVYKVTRNITNEIVSMTRNEKIDYLVIGSKYSFSNHNAKKKIKSNYWNSLLEKIQGNSISNLLSDKTEEILNKTECTVFILLCPNRLERIVHLCVIIDSDDDYKLFDFIDNMSQSLVSIQIYASGRVDNDSYNKYINKLLDKDPSLTDKIIMQRYSQINKLMLKNKSDQLVISMYSMYKDIIEMYKAKNAIPNLLCIRFKDSLSTLQ
jgi:Kef-type K+ transport system membrane component KefB